MSYKLSNLHEMAKPIFWEKWKKHKKTICCQLEVLPSMLNIKSDNDLVWNIG